ncbi:hypothetical protein NC651_027904 [Populus alba x Populus x berolinensis]|nr:hypothetical protein NC651_027904 [Populus alba x Populus x berolinensis]
MELKIRLQIFPHKSERWKHLLFVLTDTVHALIKTSFAARLMAAILGDIDLPRYYSLLAYKLNTNWTPPPRMH